jgi:Mor family transcriptional regulator
MKIHFTLTTLNELVEVEGTVDEIAQLIASLSGSSIKPTAKPASKAVSAPASSASAEVSTQIITPRATTNKHHKIRTRALQETNNFVEAIYLYEPNPAADSGRGAYIATQIVKGKSLNLDDLAKRAQGSRQTVYNTVRRMRDNGAVIELNPHSVKLISLPEPPYAAKSYAMDNRPITVPSKSAVSSQTTDADDDTANKLLNSLRGIRLA